ncbi:hypothetical protein EVAR_97294_1 [Eumeta japonica]|uniref:Uncharacterized protein n=1 Tax=Eumeta variegata TaxID=151549 RepID=A0A4C1XFU9_EUMVA|nr:hypothetical protein EVAR_97294_1 [Eumeta japonica]
MCGSIYSLSKRVTRNSASEQTLPTANNIDLVINFARRQVVYRAVTTLRRPCFVSAGGGGAADKPGVGSGRSRRYGAAAATDRAGSPALRLSTSGRLVESINIRSEHKKGN